METLGELGEFRWQMNGILSLLLFRHIISQIPEETLVKQAYNLSQEGEVSQFEWIASVKFLLQFIGMEEYFQNPSDINKNKFIMECKAKLKEKIVENWHSYMANTGVSNKLRFYKTFKQSYSKESYLNYVSGFHLRKFITKFRCSDHTLEIEKGRHRKLLVEERLCKLCRTDVVTELHFLQRCPVYENIRTQVFGDELRNNWIDILKCEDRKSTYGLANFLVKAYKLRENMLALQNEEI